MKCYSAINIKNKSKRNASVMVSVPCGKCYACRMNKRIEWTYRLYQELLSSTTAYFVTVTYDENHVPTVVDKDTGEICQVLRKSDIQSYIKRLRTYSNLRFFCVGEYGEKSKRPHYHLLIFDFNPKVRNGEYHLDQILLQRMWKDNNDNMMGYVSVGNVEIASIHYCTKDMMKEQTKNAVCGVRGFRLMSTKPAIGSRALSYLGNEKENKDFTVSLNGNRVNMPRYYREKLFSESDRLRHRNEMKDLADKKFIDEYNRIFNKKEFRGLSEKEKFDLVDKEFRNQFKLSNQANLARERIEIKSRKLSQL